jgi:hypothetical protein
MKWVSVGKIVALLFALLLLLLLSLIIVLASLGLGMTELSIEELRELLGPQLLFKWMLLLSNSMSLLMSFALAMLL